MRTNQLQHSFQNAPTVSVPRSAFNRSHGHKTTFDASYLVPVYVDEVLPGDTHNVDMSFFARLSTPMAPIMDNLHLDSHFFFVPTRLIWDNFQKFMGEKINPSDSTQYVIPQVTCTPATHIITPNHIWDAFGLPTEIASSMSVNALPFRAYFKIWDEWFRDQNLQNSTITASSTGTGDGPDNITTYNGWTGQNGFMRRNKVHDYFTACLPWPQKGDEVSIPLGTSADIHHNATNGGFLSVYSDVNSSFKQMLTDGTFLAATSTNGADSGKLYADLTGATAATINDLREAFALQAHYEKDARGGTRYTEIIRSHFGVTSPDARLQRPEYLGGNRAYVNIAPIAQTNDDISGGRPLGSLGATGIVSGTGHGFVKSFTEHGYIIGMVSARADLTYQAGLNKMWSRSTRFDFYWPSLSQLGEQAVLNKEIYFTGNSSADDAVFGYIPRYDEYRHKPSFVSGLFRSNATGSLDFWHLAEDFPSAPPLNANFVADNARETVDRVIAVPSEPQIIFDAYFKVTSVRPMPTYGIPGLRL